MAALYPTLAANPDYTAIVDDRHRDRLARLLADAVARGARAIEINPAGEDVAAAGKRAPTLLTGVDDAMAVMREEIFGPLLPVVPYRTLDEAIAFVNARPAPARALRVRARRRGRRPVVIAAPSPAASR